MDDGGDADPDMHAHVLSSPSPACPKKGEVGFWQYNIMGNKNGLDFQKTRF